MIPLLRSMYPVPKLVSNPMAKQLKETMILFSVILRNMGNSEEPLYTAIGSPLAILFKVIST